MTNVSYYEKSCREYLSRVSFRYYELDTPKIYNDTKVIYPLFGKILAWQESEFNENTIDHMPVWQYVCEIINDNKSKYIHINYLESFSRSYMLKFLYSISNTDEMKILFHLNFGNNVDI